MTLIPQIRGQLLDAAFGTAQLSTGAPPPRWSGRLVVAASILVTVAVAAVAVLSLHGSAAPPLTPAARPAARLPVAWVIAVGRAGQSTRQHDPACVPLQAQVHHQRFLTTAPPRSITAILPSLASPTRGALRVTVRKLRALNIDADGIYARYAWQGHADGIHYYVVPAAVVGARQAVPARCYQEQLAAFRKQARRFPSSQRAAAMAYAQQRLNPKAAAGVSVVTAGFGVEGASNDQAWRLAELKSNPGIGAGGGGSNTSTTTSVLVADQVASVTATYPASSHPGRVARTFSVTKRPVRNLVIFHLTGAWDPPRLTFRSKTGAVIPQNTYR